MMREKLLFVTKGGDDCDNGFSYVLELAKILNTGVAMLMVYNQQATETYEDVMAAVAFAEAGDHAMVRDLMHQEKKRLNESVEKKVRDMAEKCSDNSVQFTYQIDVDNVSDSVKFFLKNNPGIEMVLLSPNLSGNKKVFDLKKLIKNITKPIVTIHRPAEAKA